MIGDDGKRELLRHALATIAYRGGKPLREAPTGFATFKASDTTKTPVEILAHIGDLFDWALSITKGAQQWRDAAPQAWDAEVARFYATLGAFDAYLASGEPIACAAEQLLQGPVADALTHVGQIVMLRRLAGAPVRSENYFKADVVAGRVGPEQTPPKREF
jgi:hypothetical protein